MKLYIFLFALIPASCSSPSIETKSEVLIDRDKCKVVSSYPVIRAGDDLKVKTLNEYLRGGNELDRYVKNCSQFFPDDFRNKQKNIVGDYKVLFKTDSLINIEYVVRFEGRPRVQYRNIFVDMKTYKLMGPEQAIPNLQREKLYPYVQGFNDSSGLNINLKAYEKDSRYVIMFGRTNSDLILYLGGEGEFEGYYRLVLPLKEVLK